MKALDTRLTRLEKGVGGPGKPIVVVTEDDAQRESAGRFIKANGFQDRKVIFVRTGVTRGPHVNSEEWEHYLRQACGLS